MGKSARYFEPLSRAAFCQYVMLAKEKTGEEDLVFAMVEVVRKDLKVDFDLENTFHGPEGRGGIDVLLGHVTLGDDFNFWGFLCGGDWEIPVFWIVYWDGKKLRGYVPTEGNPWNTKTKRAYGNDDEADLKNAAKRAQLSKEQMEGITSVDELDLDFDCGDILTDIVTRIRRRPS